MMSKICAAITHASLEPSQFTDSVWLGPAAHAGAGAGSAGGGHRDDHPRAGPGHRSPAAAPGSESRASESGPAPPGTAVMLTATATAHGRTRKLFQVASYSGPGRRGSSRIIQLGHPAAVSAKTRTRCDSEMPVIHWQLHGIRVVRVMMVATVESVELQLDFT
jgi:hypothetical protein